MNESNEIHTHTYIYILVRDRIYKETTGSSFIRISLNPSVYAHMFVCM